MLAKDEAKKDRLATVLYNLVEGISIGAGLLEPFMPETAARIMKQLNSEIRDFDSTKTFGVYSSGTKVTDAPEILFARLDAKEIAAKAQEIAERQNAASGGDAAQENDTSVINDAVIDIEPKAEITYDDFAKPTSVSSNLLPD